MFYLEPKFILLRCDPLVLSFGGIKYECDEMKRFYEAPIIADKTVRVLRNACTPFREAYGIKASVKKPEVGKLSVRLKPSSPAHSHLRGS